MEEAVKLSMEAFHTTSDDDSKYLSDTPIPTRDPSTGRYGTALFTRFIVDRPRTDLCY